MNEKNTLVKITIIFLIIITIFSYWQWSSIQNPQVFTFHTSEIKMNGNQVTEKIHFTPDQGYRTLYRNFKTRIRNHSYTNDNSIIMQSVACSHATPYYYGQSFCIFDPVKNCNEFTSEYRFIENNEYGCTKKGVSKSDTVFYTGEEYWIEANYSIDPENLFEYNNDYYIKFVAYSEGRHPKLIAGDNFEVNGAVASKSNYIAGENVILYSKVNKNEFPNSNVIQLDSLEENDYSIIGFVFSLRTLFLLLPIILIWTIWFLFGREAKEHIGMPKFLSEYPIKRKGWGVAAFMNSPFGQIDKNFFGAILLDFKEEGIIDLKSEKKKGFFDKNKLYIKILKNKKFKLENPVEQAFYDLLLELEFTGPLDKDDYFELNETVKNQNMKYLFSFNEKSLKKMYLKIDKAIQKESKKYMDTKGIKIIKVISIAFLILIIFFGWVFISITINILDIFFVCFSIIILIALISKTSILLKFKENFYEEFLKWQAFKNALVNFTWLKEHPPEGQIIWGEYLTYATALGVAEKVLNKVEEYKLMDAKQRDYYAGVYLGGATFGKSFSQSTGKGGSGGGGMGGGAGGGGGGGR